MKLRRTQLVPQPLTGTIAALVALAILVAAWMWMPPALLGRSGQTDVFLAFCLIAALIAGHKFPIQLRHETRVYVGTVPLYLMAVLLAPPLAATSVALGKLIGELAVRKDSRAYLSDIASQVGRWTIIAFVGSLVAHAYLHLQAIHMTPLLGAAFVLWLGDIATSPVLLGPVLGEPPARIMVKVAREAGMTEAAHYLIGVLGALAAMQARWSLVLLVFPTALVYMAFKSAKDMHESARRLLASVVDASPDAILLLDLEGRVILGNGQAAAVHGYSRAEETIGLSIFELAAPDDRDRARVDMLMALETRSVRQGEYLLLRRDGTSFIAELSWSLTLDKAGRPTAMTTVGRDITERKRAEKELEHRALHDGLTRLPNRALFQQRLHEAISSPAEDMTFALFLLDLDRFKQVNDTYGHQYGDVLLQEVARRLRRTLRDSDTVARLGGDEFAVLLPKADVQGAGVVASRIEAAIAQPFIVSGQTLDIGVSIGIAVHAEAEANADALMHQADAAMYAAKRAGQGHAFYEAERASLGPSRVERVPA